MQPEFILTTSKNVQEQVQSLLSIPAIITAATLTSVEIDSLGYLLFFVIDAGMPLCYYIDAGA